MVKCSLKIAEDVLDQVEVGLVMVVHVEAYLLNRISSVGTGKS